MITYNQYRTDKCFHSCWIRNKTLRYKWNLFLYVTTPLRILFTTCYAALLTIGDGYILMLWIFVMLFLRGPNSCHCKKGGLYSSDVFPSQRHLITIGTGFYWDFWCHQCNCHHDISREAPLCAISIVTWNFSFELVLSFALFGHGMWEAPVLTNCAAKTTLHALRWAQPYNTAHTWDTDQMCVI